jgi:hypothetical protein
MTRLPSSTPEHVSVASCPALIRGEAPGVCGVSRRHLHVSLNLSAPSDVLADGCECGVRAAWAS